MGEQAIMDRYSAEPDDRLADLGVVAPQEATRAPGPDGEDDGYHYFDPPLDYQPLTMAAKVALHALRPVRC